MSLQPPFAFEHITMPVEALTYALARNKKIGMKYDWREVYPVLAQLDQYQVKRTATVFPEDCPNNAHDAFVLGYLKLPLDTGLALMEAVALDIPAAKKDLAEKSLSQWFSLSPVHWRAERDHVKLVAFEDSDISTDETKILLNSIAPWLAEWGWHIHVASPSKWFVRTLQPFDYNAPSLKLAQSDQLECFLPFGKDLKRWQTLLTEIQMLWFEHPVNQARVKNKQLPINSVWLHGCTYTMAVSSKKVNEFNVLTKSVVQPDMTQVESIYTHLAWLNEQFKPVLAAAKKNGSAIFTLLGDTWQQDIVFSPRPLTSKIKAKFSSTRRYNLMWLESPVFDFMDKH